MDFWLLDEIIRAGWMFSISAVAGPDSRQKMLVILSVPNHGAETAVVSTQHEAFQWLEGEIIQNHGATPLGRRLRGGTSGSA